MADPFTGAPPFPTPAQIEEGVFQRVGAPSAERQQAQEFASWRYNQPIGEFGTAYPKGRRQMRMQEEFQKYQTQQIEQQRAMQQLDLQRMAEERLQRDQILNFENARIEAEKEKTAQQRNEKVLNEAGMMIDSIKGAVAPDGKIIANPIRPEDDDAIERLENLARNFKFGIENKAAAEMFTSVYNDALKFREERMKDSEENERLASSLSIRTGKPFEEFGTYDEQGMFQPKMEGTIAAEQEIKAGEEAKQEEKAIAREGRGEEARVKAREEGDKRTRRKQLDDDILTEEQILIDYQNEKPSPSRDAEIKKSRDKLLNLGIKRAAVDDLVFKDQDSFKNALKAGRKIPSGTTIYIGTIPAKVK